MTNEKADKVSLKRRIMMAYRTRDKAAMLKLPVYGVSLMELNLPASVLRWIDQVRGDDE